jgi:hypothetical protein
MEPLDYWNKLKSPPKSAKKKITGGRLKGMTDIKPQWRMLVMTENFGPVGIGWKYTIEKLWTERTDDAHICAFALINLSIKHDGEWSAPIPGIGGSMLLVQETSKTHTSDEAYKMAVTDALSVAMKALGVGADVYMGYSDSKNPTHGNTPPPATTSSTSQPATDGCISDAQCKMLFAKSKAANTPIDDVFHKFEVTGLREIKKSDVKAVIEYIEVGHKAGMVNDVFDSQLPADDGDTF